MMSGASPYRKIQNKILDSEIAVLAIINLELVAFDIFRWRILLALLSKVVGGYVDSPSMHSCN